MPDLSAPPILIPSIEAPWYPDIVHFALTWNGYLRFGADRELALDANHALLMWDHARRLPDDLSLCRSFLFYEQRRWRHLESEPQGDSREYVEALLTRIRALSGGWVAGPPDPYP